MSEDRPSREECGHHHVEDLLVEDDRLRDPSGRVHYLKCWDCGLIVPAPESLN